MWGTDGLLDRLRRGGDRCGVGQVKRDTDQPRIVVARTGRVAQRLHARINRPHRGDYTPALAVQVGRGCEPESP
jgi:hypothetical protein